MKRTSLLLSLLLTGASALWAQRVTENLNFGWRFHAGNIAQAESPSLDDSSWRTVNVPHDFQIEQPWVAPSADERPDNSDAAANIRSRLSSRGFKEMGIGWYRKTVTPPAEWKGRRILLDFEGIMYTGDVYLNGKLIGGTDYGYVGFEIDVTGIMRPGQPNVIAVKADTREPGNSRWYTGGGLFRDVKLVATDAQQYFGRHPLYITTPKAEADEAIVSIGAEMNLRARENNVKTHIIITAPDGSVCCDTVATTKFNRRARANDLHLASITIAKPKRWSTDAPYLYNARVEYLRGDGSVADVAESHFGIRKLEILPDHGLLLNGKKTLLMGYANHHTLGALGAAAYPKAIEKRIRLMKEYGINHIRTSHNPYSRSFIELCDSLGILVVDELYDKWTKQHTGGRAPFLNHFASDIQEWVSRDRNSPSVVMWSLGNELQQDPNQPFNDWGVTCYRMMKPVIMRYDSTRLVTVAMHPRYRNWETDSLPCDLAMETDVQSYNYRYMYFPGDGRRFPWMKFYQSEAAMAAMGPNFFEMDLNKVIGVAYWGAIDYLGESQDWPAKGWSQGCFYIDLQPKPKAFLMKSIFTDKPVVHIAVIDKKGDMQWNGVQTGNDGMSDHWNRIDGQKLQLITYTNAEEVELLLNGKSLGKKQNSRDPKQRNQIRWNNIEYKAGTLEAVARTNGKIVARHKIETTSEAKTLRAEADNSKWNADGQDLQHILITALDKKGRRVQTAQGEVSFAVSGNAEIVGVINGDINSHEMTVGNKRSLFDGTCTVILRSTREAGPVTLTAKAEGMKPVSLKMQTK